MRICTHSLGTLIFKSRIAIELYNVFIKEDGAMPLNLSAANRNALIKIFGEEKELKVFFHSIVFPYILPV